MNHNGDGGSQILVDDRHAGSRSSRRRNRRTCNASVGRQWPGLAGSSRASLRSDRAAAGRQRGCGACRHRRTARPAAAKLGTPQLVCVENNRVCSYEVMSMRVPPARAQCLPASCCCEVNTSCVCLLLTQSGRPSARTSRCRCRSHGCRHRARCVGPSDDRNSRFELWSSGRSGRSIPPCGQTQPPVLLVFARALHFSRSEHAFATRSAQSGEVACKMAAPPARRVVASQIGPVRSFHSRAGPPPPTSSTSISPSNGGHENVLMTQTLSLHIPLFCDQCNIRDGAASADQTVDGGAVRKERRPPWLGPERQTGPRGAAGSK